MNYKQIAAAVTLMALIVFTVWTVTVFKRHNDIYNKWNPQYSMPYDRDLTDSTNLARLDSLYTAHLRDTVSFTHYRLVDQENGFVIVVAINARNPNRIIKYGVPAQIRFGGFVDIDSNPITTCSTIGGCQDGCWPYYNGEYYWTVTDCEDAVSLFPNCIKHFSFQLPEWAEEEMKREEEAKGKAEAEAKEKGDTIQ